MYVMSEDETVLMPDPVLTIRPQGAAEDEGPGDAWFINGRFSSGNHGDLAKFKTKHDARLRLDDVLEWLNAPTHLIHERRKVWSLFGWTAVIENKVPKPFVYQFSHPIGYWKEV